MKHLLLILLAATFCATASAQTIRTLGYNSTNGQIVAATNVVWTNSFNFLTNTVAAQVRTNLNLPLAALTNSNAQNFREAIEAASATVWTAGVGPGAADRALALINNDSGATVLEYDDLGGDLWKIANVQNFQSVLFAATNSAPTNTNAPTPDAWLNVNVGTNGIYKLPLWK